MSQETRSVIQTVLMAEKYFLLGGRELKEAQVPYNPVDVSSLPLGIVLRRLTRL